MSPMPADTQRFAVPDPDQLRWRRWDEETIVYHVPSGETHLLNELSAAALESLSHRPASADELAKRLAEALDLEVDATLRDQLAQLLEQFDERGLIEPVDADAPTGPG